MKNIVKISKSLAKHGDWQVAPAGDKRLAKAGDTRLAERAVPVTQITLPDTTVQPSKKPEPGFVFAMVVIAICTVVSFSLWIWQKFSGAAGGAPPVTPLVAPAAAGARVYADPMTLALEMRALAQLETVRYTAEKIVTGYGRSDGPGDSLLEFLLEDELIFIAHGIVLAGVDLKDMVPDDFREKDGVLTMRMPRAAILLATLDNEKSRIHSRDRGIFVKGDVGLETLVRQEGEAAIREAALEAGILDVAQRNAEFYLSRLFTAMGFSDVRFVY